MKALFLSLLIFLSSTEALSQSIQRVTLAPSTGPQTPFIGLGVEVDPYTKAVDPQRWRVILNHLASMQPGFFRVMFDASMYCSGFNAEDQPVYRWTTDTQNQSLKSLYQILDFAQQHHIDVYLGEWAPPKDLGITSPSDPRWPRILSDFVSFLVHERHYTQLRHVIYMNEPNGSWMWRGDTPDFASWSTGVRALRKQLDQRGLEQIELTGPDSSGDQAWFERSAQQLGSVFGAWEQHIYATDDQVASGSLEKQLLHDAKVLESSDPQADSKVHFIAESGLVTGKIEASDQQPRVHAFEYGARMADYVVQIARSGWAGADAWDLDDAMHVNGKGGLKIWGFLDSSDDATMSPRPWYYAWVMLSHALPRGASVSPLKGSATDPVRAVVAHWQTGSTKQWAIVAVNHTDRPTQVGVEVEEHFGPLNEFRYFASEQLADDGKEPRVAAHPRTRNGKLLLNLPSRGVVTVSTAP